MPAVSIIIVSMNRPDNLFPCLESIWTHTKVSYETLVVAYMFSKENLTALRNQYPWVTVIESTELRGFSENNNLALKQAKGEYCFIVNDDTLQKMPVIDRLLEDFSRLPENAAAISPCILFADGSVQTCGRAPWTLGRYISHYVHFVDETRPSRWSMKDGVFQTYTLNGACFLIKTEAFRTVGWFDERYFFTPEDIALGHALNDAGYSVWADADVEITHLAGATVSSMEAAIKPTRVRGSVIFYGEPLVLKVFIWVFESLRAFKYFLLPRTPHNTIMRNTALNVRKSVFSRLSPKAIFARLKP